jgi:anthranilate synthase/indole-3-glycerol phosphate synthase/phosphoribosylanthranilate isomerase
LAEPTILERIVARRRRDVDEAKRERPAAALRAAAAVVEPPLDMPARLRAAGPMALIAEIKRASPSRGDIAPGIDAGEQALRYAMAGAAGISVLTEPAWFKGHLSDLRAAREAVSDLGAARPAILRKDFIIDAYQVLEARAAGADSPLLIVASLTDGELGELLAAARDLGMEPLVEVNNAAEMERAVAAGARFIGINNRDLRDFSVDLGTTGRLAALVPEGVLLAALSGIRSRADVERFAADGAGAVLVGEALMAAGDPAAKIAELTGAAPPTRAAAGRHGGAR